MWCVFAKSVWLRSPLRYGAHMEKELSAKAIFISNRASEVANRSHKINQSRGIVSQLRYKKVWWLRKSLYYCTCVARARFLVSQNIQWSMLSFSDSWKRSTKRDYISHVHLSSFVKRDMLIGCRDIFGSDSVLINYYTIYRIQKCQSE